MSHSIRMSANAAALVFSILPGIGSTVANAEVSFASNSIVPQAEREALVADTGAADRIRVADRLRTLSQEIPAAACHLHNSVDIAANSQVLSDGIAQFDVLLAALRDGNADLNILGEEPRLKTVRLIETLMADVAPLRDAGLALLDAPQDAIAAQVIYDGADHYLDLTSNLLSVVEGEYANPTEIMQSDVMLLEVSGRQAMVTQQLAYDACLMWSGAASAVSMNDMQAQLTTFDRSIRALQDGRPDLGIAAAPTTEIRAALDTVAGDWGQTSQALTLIMQGEDISSEVATFASQSLMSTGEELQHIIGLYTDYSRRAY